MNKEQKSITKASNLTTALYEFFKYDPEATKKIQEPYIKYFKGCTKILDIACGRGEFLELLSENGIPGVGIELDQKMSEDLNNKGLDCICDDVFNYLKKSSDNSFDGIFTSHFIEHLEPEKIVELLELCNKVLKPNSILIITTPNVGSLPMHLDYFHRDFSHMKFYHPKIIEFFLEYSGFSIIESGTNEKFWFSSPINDSNINNFKIIKPEIEHVKIVGTVVESVRLNNPIEYVNLNSDFKKIRYNKKENPFIFLKRKISDLLIEYVLQPHFNEINKILNNKIDDINKMINDQNSNFNMQVDIIKKQNIAIKQHAEFIEIYRDIFKNHAEISEKQTQVIKDIVSWVDHFYPPSEVYVIARKR